MKKIAIVFDDAKLSDEALLRITSDSLLDKLGHSLTEHWHFV